MINLVNVSKSFGARTLLDQVNLQLGPNEKLGLVGRNGHGKSTLFKMILGKETLDGGQISWPKNYTIGYLEQHLEFHEKSILAEACLGLPDDEKENHYKAEAVLFGLGFIKSDLIRSPQEFSGGYQIRLNLAKILIRTPNLLLLDEPTNYLDIVSIRWLIKFLRLWKNELIIITHDRSFMDQVTTHTAMIHRCKIKKVAGGTQKLFEQIASEEEVYEKTRVNDEKKKKEVEDFINRFRAKASKATIVQSRVKMLESMPSNEKLSDISSLDFDFNYSATAAKELLKAENIHFHYPDNQQEIIHGFSLTVKRGDKIAIIGKNGKGKSTLLNILAGKIHPDSGKIDYHTSVKVAHFCQTHIPTLNPKCSIEDEILSANGDLNKTQIRNICATMMFTQDDATKKISVLSGGEKSRVLLGKILAKPATILFLDEPTNHLDMDAVDTLNQSIKNFPGSAIIVTHDEEMLRTIPNKFIIFQKNSHDIFDGTYEEFLEKIGWDEELNINSLNKENSVPLHHQRSELNKQKNKVLNSLKKAMDDLEGLIIKDEAVIHTLSIELTNAIDAKDTPQITQLSKTLAQTQNAIENNFLKLEELSNTFHQEEEKFNQLILNLGK